mgnify:CR=1 FL=1
MKWMIASDLHGSAYYCRKMLEAFEREGADRLFLLGDLLYHGPRNDLPREYAPKEVIPLLNGKKEKLLCVRGNCDAEVDQMVLEFPVLADYAVLPVGQRLIYATHGHISCEKSAAAGPGRCTAARAYPCSGLDRVRAGKSLSEPRFCEHPQREQPPQLHDPGRKHHAMERAGKQRCFP